MSIGATYQPSVRHSIGHAYQQVGVRSWTAPAAPQHTEQVERDEDPWTFDSLCVQLSELMRDAAAPPGPQQALPVDVAETDDAYVVEVELPGIRSADIRVDVIGNEIRVRGEIPQRASPGTLRYHTRRVGHFDNQVALPSDIDPHRTAATLDNGVLTVRAPKAVEQGSSCADAVAVPVTVPL